MPELARFLGIVIGMFYREHGVPHIHAVYGEHEISVEIETGVFTASSHLARSSSCLNGLGYTRQNCWTIGNLPNRASR